MFRRMDRHKADSRYAHGLLSWPFCFWLVWLTFFPPVFSWFLQKSLDSLKAVVIIQVIFIGEMGGNAVIKAFLGAWTITKQIRSPFADLSLGFFVFG